MTTKPERAIVPVPAQKPAKPYLDSADIVIIGNGIAGLTAAVEARRYEPDKRIVIITDQIHPTINTPALKQFAIGKLTREQLLAYPAGTERSERIHVVTARVEEIHAQSKYVTLNGKRGFGYGSLLIATGSSPMGLPESTPGRNFDGVMVMHRLQDYLDFRRRLAEVSEAVVVGGGVHAIETVMGIAHWGIRVHWLIRGDKFMGRMLDETSSTMVLERVRRAGVEVHTNTEVSGVVGRIGSVAGVITNHQEMLPCQILLTCTGTQPVMELTKHCSLPLRSKKGIIVDDQLRTSVPHIFAAGDVAALKNPQTGEYEPRAVWYAAVNQARIVGAMLAGHEEVAHQPFGVPWHATHLGELSMLTVGDPMLQGKNVETLSEVGQGGYRRMTIADNRLLGYLSLGMEPPDSLAIKRIVDEGLPIRNVIKLLLKGTFDARQYVSQHRSRVAQEVLAGQASASYLPLPRSAPVNPQLTPLPPTPIERTGQIAGLPAAFAAKQEEQAVLYEEISSFSGKLPSLKKANNDTFVEEDPFTEEISTFTGTLPNIDLRAIEKMTSSSRKMPAAQAGESFPTFLLDQPGGQGTSINRQSAPMTSTRAEQDRPVTNQRATRRDVIDSTLVPIPGDNWQPGKTGGLWAYTDQTPKKDNQAYQQNTSEDERDTLPARRPSRSLWSYTEKDKTVNVEKGR